MRLFFMTFLGLMAATGVLASVNDEVWASINDDGLCIAQISQGEANSLGVVCDCGRGGTSAIIFKVNNSQPPEGRVVLSFDGGPPRFVEVPDKAILFNDDSDKELFVDILEDIRRFQRVSVIYINGDSAEFSLIGSRNALSGCLTPLGDAAE